MSATGECCDSGHSWLQAWLFQELFEASWMFCYIFAEIRRVNPYSATFNSDAINPCLPTGYFSGPGRFAPPPSTMASLGPAALNWRPSASSPSQQVELVPATL